MEFLAKPMLTDLNQGSGGVPMVREFTLTKAQRHKEIWGFLIRRLVKIEIERTHVPCKRIYFLETL
jgi:hypothetical protein